MDTVRVSKSELLKKLGENREKHVQLHKDAMEGYFVETEKKLKAVLKRIGKRTKPISVVHFQVPVSHEKDYNKVIAMLEMSVSDEIVLKQHEFNMYVLDEWVSASEKSLLRGYALSSSNSSLYEGMNDEEDDEDED